MFEFLDDIIPEKHKQKQIMERSTTIMVNNQLIGLDVSDISIIDFPADFQFPDSLEILILVNCQIEILSDLIFANLSRLRKIILRDNRLQDIPADLFKYNLKLIEIDLSLNRLVQLPETIFNQTVVLETLHLEGNQLNSLQSEIFSCCGILKKLHLSSNDLKPISLQALQPIISTIKRIDLINNPQLGKYAKSHRTRTQLATLQKLGKAEI